MHRFWDSLVYPLFKQFTPRHIVEIGALAGDNTVKVLDYCREVGGTLTIIDPAPHFAFEELNQRYGGHHRFIQALSLEVLPALREVDAVLIDGDHNWYTVYHELKIIERLPRFPLVLLHDIEWPYGRRDLYYNPSTIPRKHRQPYSTLGIKPGQSELADGGVNQGMNHALLEGGPKNGVRTAVEDFLNQSSVPLSFHGVASHHGLGILAPDDPDVNRLIHHFTAVSGL